MQAHYQLKWESDNHTQTEQLQTLNKQQSHHLRMESRRDQGHVRTIFLAISSPFIIWIQRLIDSMKELRLHDTAFLTRCYTSHALCSYIDSEIIIRHFIISQFFLIVTVALKMIIDS